MRQHRKLAECWLVGHLALSKAAGTACPQPCPVPTGDIHHVLGCCKDTPRDSKVLRLASTQYRTLELKAYIGQFDNQQLEINVKYFTDNGKFINQTKKDTSFKS